MVFAIALLMAVPAPVAGQTPEEHEQHHPAPPVPDPLAPPDQPAIPTAPDQSGSAMQGMMDRMGVPPPKALYPSLMDLPDVTPDRRAELERLARERMLEGGAQMSAGLERFTAALQADDYAAMQDAATQVREGLGQFESGLATRQALAAGRAPRDVALEWFRREMDLPLSEVSPAAHGLFGLSWFHYISMLIMAAFVAAMIGMYFHKMRRAEALLTALATARPAPGGSAPPVAPAGPVAPVGQPPAAPSTPSGPNAHGGKWMGLLRVAAVVQETPDIRTFRFVEPRGGPLPFGHLPGQFLTLSVEIDGKTTKRAYTIASPPTRCDHVEITVKREPFGVVSGYLHDRVKVGDDLTIAAPAGYFTFTGREADSIVLIGGGVGITPLMSVVRYLTDDGWPGDIFLLASCRTARDFVFRDEIERLQVRCPNLHVTATITRAEDPGRASEARHLSAAAIGAAVPAIHSRRVHLCGPPLMMDAVTRMLSELGVPAGQIRTENFGTATRSPAAAATRMVPPSPPDAAPAPLPPAAMFPAARAPAAVGLAHAVLPTITFSRSRRAAPAPRNRTVLDVAEEIGVEIDSACRSGTCGTCKVTLDAGHVTMALDDALDSLDKTMNIILACQAIPVDDIVVQA